MMLTKLIFAVGHPKHLVGYLSDLDVRLPQARKAHKLLQPSFEVEAAYTSIQRTAPVHPIQLSQAGIEGVHRLTVIVCRTSLVQSPPTVRPRGLTVGGAMRPSTTPGGLNTVSGISALSPGPLRRKASDTFSSGRTPSDNGSPVSSSPITFTRVRTSSTDTNSTTFPIATAASRPIVLVRKASSSRLLVPNKLDCEIAFFSVFCGVAVVTLDVGYFDEELGDVGTLKFLTVAGGLRSGYDPVISLSMKLSRMRS